MKVAKNFFVSLFFLMIVMSCSKKDDAPAPSPAPASNNNFIKAMVNGVAYEATGSQINTLSDASAFNFGSDGNGTGMDFAITGAPTVKTYTFTSSNTTTVGRLQYKSPDLYTTAKCTGSGTLTITAKNGNTIEGTFSFTAFKFIGVCSEPTKAITNGTFKVTL